MSHIKLHRLRATLDPHPYFSRVEVQGFEGLIPAAQIEIRQSPDPKGVNCLVVYVPLDFVDLGLTEQDKRGK